eukprot:Opistho-2@80469
MLSGTKAARPRAFHSNMHRSQVANLSAFAVLLISTTCAVRSHALEIQGVKQPSNNNEDVDPDSAHSVKHVVIIGIDGLGSEYIHSLEGQMPNVHSFVASQGLYIERSRALFPFVSIPNWASFFVSRPPSHTGITGNVPPYTGKPLVPEGTFPLPGLRFPSLPESVRKHIPGARFLYVTEHQHLAKYLFDDEDLGVQDPVSPGFLQRLFNPHATPGLASFACSSYLRKYASLLYSGFCAEIAERKVRSHLKAHGIPALSFVQINIVDATGHMAGWGSAEYEDAISYADAQIGGVLRAFHETSPTFYEDSAIFVISDHGGKDRTHGDDNPPNEAVPLVVRGGGFPRGCTLRGWTNVTSLDIAPTVAHMLGIPRNPLWMGRDLFVSGPVMEACESTANANSNDGGEESRLSGHKRDVGRRFTEPDVDETERWTNYTNTASRPSDVRTYSVKYASEDTERSLIIACAVLGALVLTNILVFIGLGFVLARRMRRRCVRNKESPSQQALSENIAMESV